MSSLLFMQAPFNENDIKYTWSTFDYDLDQHTHQTAASSFS